MPDYWEKHLNWSWYNHKWKDNLVMHFFSNEAVGLSTQFNQIRITWFAQISSIRKIKENYIQTLSRPTGPRDDLTILATAWHAITGVRKNNKTSQTNQALKHSINTFPARISHCARFLHRFHSEREACRYSPFCVRTPSPDWRSPSMSGDWDANDISDSKKKP